MSILWLRPRCFMLENVDGCPAEIVVQFLHWALSMYDIVSMHADAAYYGCVSRRFRLYVIGVIAQFLRLPLPGFCTEFAAMARPRHGKKAHSFLLAESSPEVEQFLVESQERSAKNIAQGRVSSKYNTQWGQVHSKVYSAWKGWSGGRGIENMITSEWARCLTAREKDLANLSANFVHTGGMSPDAFSDIGELAEHGRQWSDRALPPLLSGHKVWWVNGQRPLLGVELLFAMGYPSDCLLYTSPSPRD